MQVYELHDAKIKLNVIMCIDNIQDCAVQVITSSSAIAEKPRCSVGQFWVAITPYSADRPISIK